MVMVFEYSHLLLAFVTYLIATASPGPATIAIMDIAMDKGRESALIFATGILLGSFVWALLAILGVAVLLSTYAGIMYWLKILGGLYLFWLSYKSIKKVCSREQLLKKNSSIKNKKLFVQGLALHVTNPKAIFTWVAIVSLALPQNPSNLMSLIVVVGCMLLGTLVFGGYASIFSTEKAQIIYRKFGNWLNGITALVFGVAGFKLLSSQN
jgi:threonine/homoserine/homoserine lactone efflux protein